MFYSQNSLYGSHLRLDDDNGKIANCKGFIFYKVGRLVFVLYGKSWVKMVGVYLMAAIKYLFFVVYSDAFWHHLRAYALRNFHIYIMY